MIHLLWIIPAYLLAGISIARFCMRFAGSSAESAAAVALAWPLFVPFCIVCGFHEGIRRVLVKMEERNHDNR